MKKIIMAVTMLVLTAGYCLGDEVADLMGKSGANPVAGIIGKLSMAGLMWGIVFSGVGVGAFLYGKKKANAAFILIGILLSLYTFVVQDTVQIVIVGCVLSASLYFFRRG